MSGIQITKTSPTCYPNSPSLRVRVYLDEHTFSVEILKPGDHCHLSVVNPYRIDVQEIPSNAPIS